jgi:hypothetical protein
MDILTATWVYENKTYEFNGRKPTEYRAFSELKYSLEDSKILEKYCNCLYCNKSVYNYIMVVYDILDYYIIQKTIENNQNIIYKGTGRTIYLING